MADAYIQKLLEEGYPKQIIGNGGFLARLCGIQQLNNHEHMGIYRYPHGECVHDLQEAISMANVQDEVVIKICNPCEYDNDFIEYVALWFSKNEAENEKRNLCIGYNLYDEYLNEIDGDKFEYGSETTNYWTIECAIDDVLESVFEKRGIAYEVICNSIEDFEQSAGIEK